MAKGLGFDALLASPDEKKVAREKLLGRNLLPYLNKTDKRSVDENYLKRRRLRNFVSVKKNLSIIEFDQDDKMLATVLKN
jgi:hypothetical protein